MRFDTVIIGGGLSGLACGISLMEKGQNCAIISAGQSALHFSSGSFDLLGYVNGKEIANPLTAIKELPASHPYSIIGQEKIDQLIGQVAPLFDRVGLKTNGKASKNHYRITPSGTLKPTWLSLDDFTVISDRNSFPWKNVSLQNIAGFLDFNTSFIANGLETLGVKCSISSFSIQEMERMRMSPSEMRSTNIAKEFDKPNIIKKIATVIMKNSGDAEAIILPAVFGLQNTDAVDMLRSLISKPVCFIPAVPPSVAGIRTQIMMKQHFIKLGGTFMLGDNVVDGEIENNSLKRVSTTNHGDIKIEAENFVLSTGTFFSHGIVANTESIYEPIFGLDINTNAKREDWCKENVYDDQPYMHFGVKTDSSFLASIKGEKINNLYVAGSVIGGCNAIKEASGAGVSILTALSVADLIVKK